MRAKTTGRRYLLETNSLVEKGTYVSDVASGHGVTNGWEMSRFELVFQFLKIRKYLEMLVVLNKENIDRLWQGMGVGSG